MTDGRQRRAILAAALSAAVLHGSGVAAEPVASPVPAAVTRAFGRGYIPAGGVPDSLLLDPAPPAAGSAALARDEEAAAAAVRERGSARWQQAMADADLRGANPVGAAFSCAAGLALGPDTTPATVALLRRVASDLAAATYPTKLRYKRPRPFMANGQPSCTPQDEPMLRNDGSYPSGHSALGYGWSLVLAELVPARAAQLVARGRDFGDSRRICNVHWLSDVEEGRVVATAVIARAHAEPDFRRDLDLARQEIAGVRATPTGCSAGALPTR